MNQAVMRAQRFFESEIGNSTLPDTYYKANGGEPDTRSADSRFMLSGAIEPDWSMAQTWEYEQDIVTEVPALLTLPIRYTTLIEERGDTVSLTTQAPHSRLRIIENPETGVMYSFVITLLPDESYGGDPSLLGSHPIESDYWGISVYSKPDGTPEWGYRYANGEITHSLVFDADSENLADPETRILMGFDTGTTTRAAAVWIDGVICIGHPPKPEEEKPGDGTGKGKENEDEHLGGGGNNGTGGNPSGGGGSPVRRITVTVPNGFCVLGSIAAAIQVKFGDNASTAIDKAEAAMNAAGITTSVLGQGATVSGPEIGNVLISLGFTLAIVSHTANNISSHFSAGGFGIGFLNGPPSHQVFVNGFISSGHKFRYYDPV